MKTQRHTADEQYQLIMECRSSVLSNYQWCTEHNINPCTFYNWVKRLRKKFVMISLFATERGDYRPALKQDVVQIPDNQSSVFPVVKITMLPLEESTPPLKSCSGLFQ